MQISKASIVGLLATAAVLQLQGQPASSEQQARAVELLRQAIAQDHAQSPATAKHKAAPKSAPAAPQVIPQYSGPSASRDQQELALQQLRMAITEDRIVNSGGSSKKSKGASKSVTPTAPSVAGTVTQPAHVNVAPVTPMVPSISATKQQKLIGLLELYKADKLTPAEYHAQRAKILSEP